MIERLVEQGSLVRDGGKIVGAYGLSLRPARHWLTLDGWSFSTWCAFDAVGIPAALQRRATVESTCAHCGTPIAFAVEAGVPHGGGALRLWYADADFDRSLSAT